VPYFLLLIHSYNIFIVTDATVNVPETVNVAIPSPFGAVVLTLVPGAKDTAPATPAGYLTITIS
jgi:hypothetical protein